MNKEIKPSVPGVPIKRTKVVRTPTRKQQILSILSTPGAQHTCGEICKRIVEAEKLTGNVARYLSGSISSILNKLVKEKVLKYSAAKGPKGGYVYRLNTVEYVCGFMFNETRSHVALIEKQRPDYQKGLLNGIGGKINDGETAKDAMVREFEEETGVKGAVMWDYMLTLKAPGYIVHFYFNWCSEKFFQTIKTTTDEEVKRVSIADLFAGKYNTMGNTIFLVDMALYLIENPNEHFSTI